jgi:8-oxo-dGTP pyrophosphatase MutT (NUDIX family)
MVKNYKPMMQTPHDHPMQPHQTQAGAVLADPNLLELQKVRDSILGIVNRYAGSEQERNKLRESLVTALTYSTPQGRSEYGAVFRDPFATLQDAELPGGAAGNAVYVSPYPKATVVTDVAVTYAIPETQEVFVLLERKLKDPSRPELGMKEEFILPGGHLEAHTPNEPNVTTRPFDKDLAATARREVREETNLILPEHYEPKSLGVGSEYGVNGDPREHPVVDFRHVNMTGSKADFEALKRSMKASSDAAEIRWVNARDFEYHPDTPPQAFGSTVSRYHINIGVNGQHKHLPVRDDHGAMLDKAVSAARTQLLLERQKMHGYQEAPAAVPSTALGPQADALHREQVAYLDRFMKQETPTAGKWTQMVSQQAAGENAPATPRGVA